MTAERTAGPAAGGHRAGSGQPGALFTVGHGTLTAEAFLDLLAGAGIERLVDVRTAPGSRRVPHFTKAAMEGWVEEAGISYRSERDLGGFRRALPDSRHLALRNDSFRGYADYMETAPFRRALETVLAEVERARVAVMCSETLWWRCHRRLIADAVELGAGRPVLHLMHDGREQRHRLTEGVRREDTGGLIYDLGADRPLDL